MILRRIKFGQFVEGIEIIPADGQLYSFANGELFGDESVKVSFLEDNKDSHIYQVNIPKQLRVKPQDLKRFAYDHEKVVSLVVNCITDNLAEYTFETQNERTLDNLKQELLVALQDFSTIMQLISVECCAGSDDKKVVTVIFEYKNGEARELVVSS
ncbi:MAG: hypothetical protein KZQ77_11555 [Candidatus Thiodiazotropha sp. (ex Notomyrtea botanica)]|nr:hypothetical protein [Candidatus Thiodiazotropha sp. (ex Notomyrtea botanica)]